MSRLRVTICRVEDDEPDKTTALTSFGLPQHEIYPLTMPQTLDDLELQTYEIGNPIIQKIMETRWEVTDQKLTQKACQDFPPQTVKKDRSKFLKVASRCGTVYLKQTVLSATKPNTTDQNAILKHTS